MNNKGLVARRKPNSLIPEISGLGTGNHIVLGVSVIAHKLGVYFDINQDKIHQTVLWFLEDF